MRPDVENLAVLVLEPVAMREDELVDARRGHVDDGTYGTPGLRALDALPGLDRLGQLEALRLGVRDAEKDSGLAVAEAAELSALHLDDRRIEIGWCGRQRALCGLLLRKGIGDLQCGSGECAPHECGSPAQQLAAIQSFSLPLKQTLFHSFLPRQQ